MDNVINAIEEITTQGGEQNFCIIYLTEDYYLQFTGSKDSNELYCEAVSNQFLVKELQLSDIQNQQLLDLGWSEADFGNYSKTVRIQTAEAKIQLVKLIMETAKDVYKTPINDDTEFTIELE